MNPPATIEAQFAAIEKMQKELGRLIAVVAETIRVSDVRRSLGYPRPSVKKVTKKRLDSAQN